MGLQKKKRTWDWLAHFRAISIPNRPRDGIVHKKMQTIKYGFNDRYGSIAAIAKKPPVQSAGSSRNQVLREPSWATSHGMPGLCRLPPKKGIKFIEAA